MDTVDPQQLQAGDPQAISQVVECYHRPLLGFLYHTLNGDLMLAEDLVQETFLRMFRALPRYDPQRPFKAWLYAIATNLARDHYKQAENRHTITMPAEAEEWQGQADVILPDALPPLEAYLLRLPPHQRETLLLRYYQELSLQEIADIQAIPLGTVKSRLSLALRGLRAMMEEDQIHAEG